MSKILYFVFGLLSLTNLYTAEIDHGLVIIDRKPWKISWVQESENIWVLLARFDNGNLKTYFKNAPPSKGFGLTPANKPIKQEFEYYPSGKTFVTKEYSFEQWEDGAKAYSFSYKNKFKMDGNEFDVGTTAIIEEVDVTPNEVRYSIFRVYQ